MKRNYIKFLGRLLARELRNDLANTDDGVGEQALARPAGWHHFADPDVELAVADRATVVVRRLQGLPARHAHVLLRDERRGSTALFLLVDVLARHSFL
jgi:hypothetical protein